MWCEWGIHILGSEIVGLSFVISIGRVIRLFLVSLAMVGICTPFSILQVEFHLYIGRILNGSIRILLVASCRVRVALRLLPISAILSIYVYLNAFSHPHRIVMMSKTK